MLMYNVESKEALKQFGITTQPSPHVANWLTVIPVISYYILGDWKKALESGEQALARFPDYPYAYVNLAGVYNAAGLQEKAHDHGKQVVTNTARLLPR